MVYVSPAPDKPLSRRERRHGSKARPAAEPVFQIPKGALIAAATMVILGVILGIRTSLQAASSHKPFTMPESDKKGKGKGGGGDGKDWEAHPRDTAEGDAPNGDWLTDPIMAKSLGISRCDLDRVPHANMTTKRFAREYEGLKPVIIEGLLDEKWPAKNRGRWARPSIMSAFPDAAVHVSSGAGIVHSGGESLRTLAMTDFLDGLRENDGDGESATAFTFDLEFLDRNTELKQDYKVPTIFRRFNSHESMRRGMSWSMLSLGASGAGLPFHTHGETWLGVVYGEKRWALYPPSASRPYSAEKKAGWHPLQGSLEWFRDVGPAVKSTGETPPLECMQRAGDIIYVPANWKHMTLNIGESIGVGGQAVYNGETRLRDGLDLLVVRPDDPEILHAVGVGLAHRGIAALKYEGAEGGDEGVEMVEMDHATQMNMLRAGQYLSAKQTIDMASHNLRQATTDRPGYPESHIILAETLAKGGHDEDARKVIEDAWKTFSRDELPDGVPDSTLVAVQLNLARFFLQTHDGPTAEAYLKKGALALMPEHGDALADLSVALAMQGEGDLEKVREAISTIERAERLGASGDSFNKRREYVIRMGIKAQQDAEAAADAAAAAAEAAAAAAAADASDNGKTGNMEGGVQGGVQVEGEKGAEGEEGAKEEEGAEVAEAKAEAGASSEEKAA